METLALSARTLVDAVTTFSKPIVENFGKNIEYTLKDDNTPLSVIDTTINDSFADWVKLIPNLGMIGEEGNQDTGNKFLLLVDPLDGTGAFLRGMATCTVIATIMKMKDDNQGEAVCSVIYNPITKEVWCGEDGEGAYKMFGRTGTEEILHVSPRKHGGVIRTAICAWPEASHDMLKVSQGIASDFLFNDQQMGALGIGGALVAQGTIDATVCGVTSAVEVAAMSLLVKEAGGVCIDLCGKPINSFELGVWKGKEDFLLPNGAIVASDQTVAKTLLDHIHKDVVKAYC